jgi:hypothetical protein
MLYRNTRVWSFEGFESWWRTKLNTKLNINEKIRKILDWLVVGSRFQAEAINQFPQ